MAPVDPGIIRAPIIWIAGHNDATLGVVAGVIPSLYVHLALWPQLLEPVDAYLAELEKLNANARQALLMADEAQRAGDTEKAAELTRAAETIADEAAGHAVRFYNR